MKKILLYSTGGFGDALVLTHLATLLQQRLLDVHVDFCINHDFAFQFGNGNNKDAVEILKYLDRERISYDTRQLTAALAEFKRVNF